MDLLYRKVSKLTNRKKKKQNICICDKEGNVSTDSDKERDRWKEYIEDLYDKISRLSRRLMGLPCSDIQNKKLS